MYTNGDAPAEAHWDQSAAWQTDPDAQYAEDLFDNRYYWEAHEAWEAMWHSCTPGSPAHKVLQSLIQIAAAVLQHHMGSKRGSRSLLGRAKERLSQANIRSHEGINLEALIEQVELFFNEGPWPTIRRDST